MSIVKSSLIFLTGAAIGSGVTWFFMQKKVDAANAATQKAVDEVKESYSRSKQNEELKKDISDKESEPIYKTMQEAVDAVRRYNIFDDERAEEMIKNQEPPIYISEISMEDFDSDEEYTHQFLTYYEKDDVVVDSQDYTPMEDPEDYLGDDFKEFLEDEEAVYIRNEREGCLYEVVVDRNETLNDVLREADDEYV